jgi:non-ribosomal peptide synthetase component F
LFATDTSGYTQYGRAYLSLQSAVSDQRFIDGYVRAAAVFGVAYTPVIDGTPAFFQGGAAFPGNDWTVNPLGEEYLTRIPARSHRALAHIRAFHLRVTRDVLRRLEHDRRPFADVASFDCK